jgi:hypothetical protein
MILFDSPPQHRAGHAFTTGERPPDQTDIRKVRLIALKAAKLSSLPISRAYPA